MGRPKDPSSSIKLLNGTSHSYSRLILANEKNVVRDRPDQSVSKSLTDVHGLISKMLYAIQVILQRVVKLGFISAPAFCSICLTFRS
jgi:predicted membrane protein